MRHSIHFVANEDLRRWLDEQDERTQVLAIESWTQHNSRVVLRVPA